MFRVMSIVCCAFAASLLAGCFSIDHHKTGELPSDIAQSGIYSGTRADCGVVAVPFSDPKGPEGGIAKALCTILLPVSIIDLPLELVADTVTLPYDIYADCTDKGKK